jgi:diamine N-acetyltransferase
MSPHTTIELRPALASDTLCLSALATQVFFDTYATSGINLALANEAKEHYSEVALAARLATPGVQITVAEADGILAGFIDVQSTSTCPVPNIAGPEVFRLYIQTPIQNRGVGKQLLRRIEKQSLAKGAQDIWLTAWVGNTRAAAFYSSVGFKSVGTTQYIINGTSYENYVFAKPLSKGGA